VEDTAQEMQVTLRVPSDQSVMVQKLVPLVRSQDPYNTSSNNRCQILERQFNFNGLLGLLVGRLAVHVSSLSHGSENDAVGEAVRVQQFVPVAG
jgi:hypothetical protein